MELGGTDEVFYHRTNPVTALRLACEVIRKHWPSCVVEYEKNNEYPLHEVFVYLDAHAKTMWEPYEDEKWGPTLIHLLARPSPACLSVRHMECSSPPGEFTVAHDQQYVIAQEIKQAIIDLAPGSGK